MEIYLCYMYVYRFFEKLNLTLIKRNEKVSYSLIDVMTIASAVAVSFCWSTLQKADLYINYKKDSRLYLKKIRNDQNLKI